jgi:hypothetical protein
MKNSSDTIGNRTRDLPACSAVPSEVRRHLKFLHADTKIWCSIADVVLPMCWPRRYDGLIADRVRYFCLLWNVWIGFGAHPDYLAVFPWGMKRTINPSVVLSLRMDGAVSPHTHIFLHGTLLFDVHSYCQFC